MIIEDEHEEVNAGSIIIVPPKHTQHIRNTGSIDLEFYCIVSPPWTNNQDYNLTS
jgi:mannose-6-phosphate isomerase-like protein (cupin superfamily)